MGFSFSYSTASSTLNTCRLLLQDTYSASFTLDGSTKRPYFYDQEINVALGLYSNNKYKACAWLLNALANRIARQSQSMSHGDISFSVTPAGLRDQANALLAMDHLDLGFAEADVATVRQYEQRYSATGTEYGDKILWTNEDDEEVDTT